MNRKGFTLVELMVVMGIIMVLAGLLLPTFARARERAHQTVCASNIRQILMALSLYAEENRGRYPPCDDSVPANLIVNGESIFPEYISDLNLFGCPSSILFEKDVSFTRNGKQDPVCLTAISYIYTGYMITRDEEAYAGTQAHFNGFGMQFGYYPTETNDDDIDVGVIGLHGYGNGGGDIIYRLRTQAAGILAQEVEYVPARGILVIADQMGPNMMFFSHRPLGGNVGYLDGHVEFVRYELPPDPKNFPMSPYMVQFAQGYGPPDLSESGCQ
jgi:prepilin-type N-terminal cleavage/methylation domain-containing protein/prepilin-type processing-associated H-X9-DG protein